MNDELKGRGCDSLRHLQNTTTKEIMIPRLRTFQCKNGVWVFAFGLYRWFFALRADNYDIMLTAQSMSKGIQVVVSESSNFTGIVQDRSYIGQLHPSNNA